MRSLLLLPFATSLLVGRNTKTTNSPPRTGPTCRDIASDNSAHHHFAASWVSAGNASNNGLKEMTGVLLSAAFNWIATLTLTRALGIRA